MEDGDKYPLGDKDIPKEGEFRSHGWVKTINSIPGIITLAIAACFIVAVILYLIIQINLNSKVEDKNTNLFKYIIDYFSLNKEEEDKTRPARIIVFLVLATGLVLIVFYNINKMRDRPRISVTLVDNYMSPTIQLCPRLESSIEYAVYTEKINDVFKEETTIDSLPNLTSYDPIYKPDYLTTCYLFNYTSLPRPKKDVGMFYAFIFNQTTYVDVFIGDDKNTDWSLSIPESKGYGDVGSQTILSYGLIFYTETRYIELDKSHIHRGFQCSALTYDLSGFNETRIGIHVPKQVITQVEEPALELADAFGNIGGYISICGLFAFLFGEYGIVTYFSKKGKESDDKGIDGKDAV
ncbi:813_t:CDS:1 [Diversispora eburnea]|uniref:813_t:CDS:1 n=1 Tax=Diversispora eburnea TaxID=1213867 RepID=A0A9N9CC98_9GLOM|nr:813_t:CDS:1 [Diversispora eburnea]